MRTGLVLGCGGPIGFAWSAVTLTRVQDALGWDAREADVIQGTSAGAELAALLGAGFSAQQVVDDLDAVERGPDGRDAVGRGAAENGPLRTRLGREPAPRPSVPRPGLPGWGLVAAAATRRIDATAGLAGLLPRGRGDCTFLRDFADELAGPSGWVGHPHTRLVAADARSGALVPFGAPTAPRASLADALAASWAIPGWYPPVRIAGRNYLDGGTVSPTSAHLLAELDLEQVVIVAPMSTRSGAPGRGPQRIERLLRRVMTARVDAEVATLQARGIKVIRVEPDRRELDAMGANFTDVRRRAATLRAARENPPSTIESPLERA